MSAIWSIKTQPQFRVTAAHSQDGARVQALSAINKDEAELISLKTALNDVCEHFQAALQSRKDVYRAVHALPKAVLLLIFQFAVFSDSEQNDSGRTALWISRTCSSWRKVAFETPGLWCTLDLFRLSRAEAELYAKISTELPLRIIVDSPYAVEPVEWVSSRPLSPPGSSTSSELSKDPNSVVLRYDFCKNLLPRIEELCILYCHPNQCSHMPSWMNVLEAPQLRALTIKVWTTMDDLHSLFAGGKPNLATLILDGVFVSWTSLAKATSLTTLHMIFPNRRRGMADDALDLVDADILSLFGGCPLLEDVFLASSESLALGSLRSLNTCSSPTVMARLRKLRLSLVAYDISFIMRCIILPKVMLRLHITGTIPQDADGHPIEKTATVPIHPPCLPCLALLSKLIVDVTKCIYGWFHDAQHRQAQRMATPLQIRIIGSDSGVGRGPLISKTLSATFGLLPKFYNMPHLTELDLIDDSHLRPSSRLSVDDIMHCLRSSPGLKVLRIDGCDPALLEKLTKQWKYSYSSARSPLCPSLSHLSISRIEMRLSVLLPFCYAYFGEEFQLAGVKEALRNQSRDDARIRHESEGRERELRFLKAVYVIGRRSGRVNVVDGLRSL